MTEFEKIYQNYNPRQAALDEARALLTAAAKAAMADGALPEAELPPRSSAGRSGCGCAAHAGRSRCCGTPPHGSEC